MQRVQTSYVTAIRVQQPRSITKIVNNVLQEAALAGKSFYYRWEVWDKEKGRKVPIEGPSIDLAMCVARNYGNAATDITVEETPTHYLFKGIFIDLETGFTCPRLFRQRKKQKLSDKMDAERQEDIVFQIGQSKAIRNAVVKAMPEWLFEQAIERAKAAELGKIKPDNIHIARQKVLDFFYPYGVTQDRIEAERGKPADKWIPQDIVDLRGMATALKEGRVGPDELFPPVVSAPEPKDDHPKRGRKPKDTQPEQPAELVKVVDEPDELIDCPNGDRMKASYCQVACSRRDGCPSWPEREPGSDDA